MIYTPVKPGAMNSLMREGVDVGPGAWEMMMPRLNLDVSATPQVHALKYHITLSDNLN